MAITTPINLECLRDQLLQMGFDSMYDIYYNRLHVRSNESDMEMQFDLDGLKHLSGNYIAREFYNAKINADDYMNDGCTNAELRDPRIARAYEDLQILRKLIGIKK